MKLINSSFEILDPEYFTTKLPSNPEIIRGKIIKKAKRQIEYTGRICYKSENRIDNESYKKFFEMIKDKGHLSVFEHGTLYFKIILGSPAYDANYLSKSSIIQFFKRSPHSKVIEKQEPIEMEGATIDKVPVYYITTNYRVFEEKFKPLNKRFCSNEELFSFLSLPTENHEWRYSVKFICSRAIANELVRHRIFSFSQESQRYCNYSLGKFGEEITFIKPEYANGITKFEEALKQAEDNYFYLIGLGWKPQEAREVLPNATKTEIVMTGFASDWQRFFELRTAENAHPEMRRLIVPLQESFKDLGYVE